MHDSSFWYQYSTVGPRRAREGPRGAQHPLALPQIRLWYEPIIGTSLQRIEAVYFHCLSVYWELLKWQLPEAKLASKVKIYNAAMD